MPERELYEPGDQLNFLCNDGYAVQLQAGPPLNNVTSRISNMHVLECSFNGTWFLVDSVDTEEVAHLPACVTLRSFNLDPTVPSSSANLDDDGDLYQSSSSSFSYDELNLRSFLLAFTIGAILIVVLILTVLAKRFFYRRQRNGTDDDFLYQNYLAQIDPTAYLVVANGSNFNAEAAAYSNELCTAETRRSMIMPSSTCTTASAAISLAFGTLSQQQQQQQQQQANNLVVDGNLPSYEEAVNTNCSSTNTTTTCTRPSVSQLVVPQINTTDLINQVD